MPRILQLDGVRAIAFLMIFFRHGLNVPFFWVGVDIFFVLSGFLITSILINNANQNHAWRHFYERRALRILPPYFAVLIFGTFFFHIHWGSNIFWYLLFGMNIADTLNVGVPLLATLWSLAVEEQFYVFWPFIALRLSPRMVLRSAVVIVIATPLLRALITPFISTHWPIYLLTPFRMDLLASGAILAVLWKQNKGDTVEWRNYGLLLLVSSILAFLVCTWLVPGFRALSNTVYFNCFGYSIICAGITGAMAVALSGKVLFLQKCLTAAPIRWIGTISYTGYLIHAWLLGLVTPFSNQAMNFVAALIATLAIASFSWLFFEKPILRLRLLKTV
jgi:peptidoglycan/LPS O-acetylase OafA/YrhL